MKILKFGGTSVGSPVRMKALLEIIRPEERQIVVLSAVAGTTNALVEIAGAAAAGRTEDAHSRLAALRQKYSAFTEELLPTGLHREEAEEAMSEEFGAVEALLPADSDEAAGKAILAAGELLSTRLFTLYLHSIGIRAVLLPALEFMRIGADEEPDLESLSSRLGALLAAHSDTTLFITQGFICRNAEGEIDNLRRGGSDYTASLIGAALRADEVQIWTDIDGLHNNDPRIVEGTQPVRRLSYPEAAELAYFGAKILHPRCVTPAQLFGIPLKLLNTMQPDAPGTLISAESEAGAIKSIAAKDGITVIRLQSNRMLLAYGYLKRIFEIFERHKTPVDVITTSEVAVSLTIDDATHLAPIVAALKTLGEVTVEDAQAIVCIVGDFGADTIGLASTVFSALRHLPVRMISYGGSPYNISLIVHERDKAAAMRSLHAQLFSKSSVLTNATISA